MYKVVIDKLATGLFLDTGANIKKESAVGILINSENIMELIENIIFHELFHIFVLLGSLFHFIMIFCYIA